MGATWYYKTVAGATVGPVSLEVLRQLFRDGTLLPSDMVRPDRATEWIQAAQVKQLCPGSVDPAQSAATVSSPSPVPLSLDACETPSSSGNTSSVPTKASEVGKRLWSSLKNGAVVVARFTKSVAVATMSETRRQRDVLALKRRLREIEESQFKLERDVGARLLASGSVPRDGEEFAVRFGQLNQAYTLANQALQAGDKTKKPEATRLAKELQSLYVDCGRMAITQARTNEFAFKCDNEAVFHSDRLKSEATTVRESLVQLEEKWRAANPQTKRKVFFGVTACVALICSMFVWVLSRSNQGSSLPNRVEVASTSSGQTVGEPVFKNELAKSISLTDGTDHRKEWQAGWISINHYLARQAWGTPQTVLWRYDLIDEPDNPPLPAIGLRDDAAGWLFRTKVLQVCVGGVAQRSLEAAGNHKVEHFWSFFIVNGVIVSVAKAKVSKGRPDDSEVCRLIGAAKTIDKPGTVGSSTNGPILL